jgi:hypothetical protein
MKKSAKFFRFCPLGLLVILFLFIMLAVLNNYQKREALAEMITINNEIDEIRSFKIKNDEVSAIVEKKDKRFHECHVRFQELDNSWPWPF